MERYEISEWNGGCCIAKYDGNGHYSLWRSSDCKWQTDGKGEQLAIRACYGFEDDFHLVSKAKAMEIIKSYGGCPS